MQQLLNPPIIAIDPGRTKCGIAVVKKDRIVLEKEIIRTESLNGVVSYLIGKYGSEIIVLGDRTYSKNIYNMLRQSGFRMDIIFVDEDRSSELGRRKFLLDNPAKGFAKLLPLGLRSPDRPYDDYVAIILAERYLDGIRSLRRKKK